MQRARILLCILVPFIGSLLTPAPANAAWMDSHWPYRRAVDVNWDYQHPSGANLAMCEFYTDGHCLPNAADVRVADKDGKIVPSHVLRAGPGDRVSVAFALSAPEMRYYVYFGNPSPGPAPDAGQLTQFHCGLLLEMRRLTDQQTHGFDQIEGAWNSSADQFIGQTMIDSPFYGVNPFGDENHIITKMTGSLFAPVDGDYLFCGACESRGALYIDGQRTLFIPACIPDTRFHRTIHLSRGAHDFVLYDAVEGGELRFSIGWQRPDMNRVEVIGRDAFGVLAHGNAGALEELDKTLVADATPQFQGEAFTANMYFQRFHFDAPVPEGKVVKVHWDFGDGQTATGPSQDHVYLVDGVYPVQVKFTLGGNSDTQTLSLPVSRQWPILDQVSEDDTLVQSHLVGRYDVDAMPLRWLAPALQLHLSAHQAEAAAPVATRLASIPQHADPEAAYAALSDAAKLMIETRHASAALKMWASAPADSDLQPRAARAAAQICLWHTANFDQAVALLKPFANSSDQNLQRVYGEALLLSGDVKNGEKILQGLPDRWSDQRIGVMSGAMARTIEFFINTGDWESGEDDWEKWTSHQPASFLQGYSVVLRTRLMKSRGDNLAAAKVSEAFASAEPTSSYAPQLLDQASKLLAQSDPQKSAALRQQLKTRYPEDPLSQDNPPAAEK
jgi:hypothetical protein